MRKYDVIILGAGIIGAFTAKELSRYKLDILILDQADDIGTGAAKANSGVLYPGFHPRAGSLKGVSCVQGNAMYTELAEQLGVNIKRTGSLYVMFGDGEEKLMERYNFGLKNGVKDMSIISGEEARSLEPALSHKVKKALYEPNAGLISPFELIWKTTEFAAINGVEFRFNTVVENIIVSESGITLKTSNDEFDSRYVVNAAGENAAIAESWVRPQNLIIKPRRGQYYIFDKQSKPFLNRVIYQVQESDEGGTLIAPTIEGNIIAGPTSEDIPSYRCTETTQAGLDHVERVAKKILPELNMGQVIANFAGVRTNIKNLAKEDKDFIIRLSAQGMVSALGIKNPGMTAAPYLAKKIVDLLFEQGLNKAVRTDYIPYLEKRKPFLMESEDRQRRMFLEDPRYGQIICRCENITLGDIINTLNSPLPPRNISGLKLRLRVGAGRCQGAFCTSRIIGIMAQELGISAKDINKYGNGSNYVKGSVKH